jgi:Fic family protein
MNKIILNSLWHSLLSRCPLDAFPEEVWKRAGALNTWGTNAIEGNTLTWAEVERLLIDGRSVGGRPILDVLETLQHEAAFRRLMVRRRGPISLVTVLELHEEVFRGVKADAGQWRRVNVRITGSRHNPPRMEKVLPMMEEWTAEYSERDLSGEDIFRLGAWMHLSFESIHPFSDGNGRVGRLLLNLHFMRHSWPPVHVLPSDRELYLRAIQAGISGDLLPLTDLLLSAMTASILDLLDQVGTKDDELLPLKKLSKAGPYSAQYLSLRAGKGEFPAVKRSGDWHSSARALHSYRENVGRV